MTQQIEPGSGADKMQQYVAQEISNQVSQNLTPAQWIARAIVVGTLAIDRVRSGAVKL